MDICRGVVALRQSPGAGKALQKAVSSAARATYIAAMARHQATPETRSVRLLKVGEQVRHVISELLSRQMVHDEVLTGHTISVTEVRMSPDLRHATVFVKPLLGADEDVVLKALRTHTAFFQKEVAGKLKLKYAAKIKFLADESFDEASRIDMLLNDPRVQRDLAGDGDS